MRMFLQCLLVDLVAAIFFVAGLWFALALITQGVSWCFVAVLLLIIALFNVLTEVIWRKK